MRKWGWLAGSYFTGLSFTTGGRFHCWWMAQEEGFACWIITLFCSTIWAFSCGRIGISRWTLWTARVLKKQSCTACSWKPFRIVRTEQHLPKGGLDWTNWLKIVIFVRPQIRLLNQPLLCYNQRPLRRRHEKGRYGQGRSFASCCTWLQVCNNPGRILFKMI